MSSNRKTLSKTGATNPQKDSAAPQPGQKQQTAIARFEGQVVQMNCLPPEILAQFNDIIPGSAQLLLDNTLEESKFRREMEERTLDANIANQSRQLDLAETQTRNVRHSDLFGQVCGLAVCAGCIGGSIYLGIHFPEHWKVPVALAAIPTAAIIRAFFIRPEFFARKKQPGGDS